MGHLFNLSSANYTFFVTESFYVGFLFFECRIIDVVTNTAADMFLDI